MEMFSYGFMQNALIAAVMMAAIAPMLGLFLIIRRQSLLADTLSHVSLTGVALGLLLNINPTIFTLIVVIIAAVLMEFLRNAYKTYSEVATAILMSGGMALALVLMSFTSGGGANVQQFLFGSIVTIGKDELSILFVLFILIIVFMSIFKKPMYVLVFDEDMAQAEGLPVKWMSMFFNVVTGVAIAVMMPIAGALLVSAIMVLPAAIAMRMAKSFNHVLLISILVGLVGMISGLIGSFELETPAGASIALVFIVIFILTTIIRSLLTRRRKRTNLNK